MRIIFLTCFLLILTGCFGPLKRFQRATDKVEAAKTEIIENKSEQIDKSKGFIAGTGYALSIDPNPSIYSEAALSLNTRAQNILGAPDLKTLLEFQSIVDKLVSTNTLLQIEGKRLLAKKDGEIIKLESKITKLEENLKEAENKAAKVNETNATLANKWARMWFFIKIGIFSFIGIFVLRVVATALPPPYNGALGIFDFIIGGLFKGVSKIFTSATSAAGVVGKEAFDVSEKSLRALVDSIQKARQDEQMKAKLDPILKDATDKEIIRPKIIEVKTQLGHI